MVEHMKNYPQQFRTSVVVTQIKYGLIYLLCHLPQYWYGSQVPKPVYGSQVIKTLCEAKPSTLVVGSPDPYKCWGRWHSFAQTYLICIITQAPKIILTLPLYKF